MKDFSTQLGEIGEYGVVDQVQHPVVHVRGLPGARLSEIVVFENGASGSVFLLERESVQILAFSRQIQKVGSKVTRTDAFLSVPVGKALLGQAIDPLGNPLIETGTFVRPKEEREIEVEPLGIAKRVGIRRPFLTGITLVDMMLPLGRGQKELVLGDRSAGKTSFLLMTIKNQVKTGTLAIYTAIGAKKEEVKKIYDFLQKEHIFDRTVVVATTSHDSPSLIYLTPYSAMTVAEYFRDQGWDVLIVLDDLRRHAQFYREISLLTNRFPGRESYPGDIFYAHARLLERAGNFRYKDGEVSITALPVVSTVEGDFTGYIPTNLIGITDGHLFFDSNLYYRGRRPAINISLSVTRVGRQVQSELLRNINRELTAFIALYENMQNLSHFGAELSTSVKHILSMGDRLYTFFEQPFPLTVPLEVQLVLFGMLWLMLIDASSFDQLSYFRENLIRAFQDEQNTKIFQEILKAKSFNEFLGLVSKRKVELLSLCKISKN